MNKLISVDFHSSRKDVLLQLRCFAVLLPTVENAMAQREHVTVALVSGKEVVVPATVAWSERSRVRGVEEFQ